MHIHHQYQPPHHQYQPMTSTYHGPSTSERPTREATPVLHIGPPRRPDQSGEASVYPITLGFAKLNARLDSMDRRVDILESRRNTNDQRRGKLRLPQRPDPEPPYALPDRGGADWDKQHRRYTQPTYRRPQHHQSDRYPPPPPYQPDRSRPYHLHQTRYQLPEHYQPCDYGPPPTYRRFPLHQFLQLQNEPSRQPSCWDPPGAWMSIGNLDDEEIASIYCPDYDGDSDGYDEDADVHRDPSSNSQLTVIVVPPPPPQRSSSCWSMTSHCRSVASLPAVAAVPSSNLPPTVPSCSPDDDSGEERGLIDELPPPAMISPPCSPYISGEEETLLDGDEEVDSIEEVKKAVVARVTSQDVVENCLGEKGELHDSDVARMFQRPTLLAIDARMVPPRNYTACLGVRGRVNKLHVLALNFDDCFDPTLMIFYGEGEVTRPTIRYAFDPGGDASPSFCFQLSSLVRGSHLEDKVDFNRGGVDTSILSLFISLDILGICISFLIFVSCSLS